MVQSTSKSKTSRSLLDRHGPIVLSDTEHARLDLNDRPLGGLGSRTEHAAASDKAQVLAPCYRF